MAEREAMIVMCELLTNELRVYLNNVKNKKKKLWVRDWVKRRNILGATNTICRELSTEDQGGYKNFFRMNRNQYAHLLNKVKTTIQKRDTNMTQI
jgi:hypothetical protein